MKHWRDNEHWMVRDGDEEPGHDPAGGCEGCGWVDERGVRASDLIWSPTFWGWLCMECD